jgi:hypothetical protein
MVIEEGDRATDAVIVIEPIRSSTHRTTANASRHEESMSQSPLWMSIEPMNGSPKRVESLERSPAVPLR